MNARHLLTIRDLTFEDVEEILTLTRAVKDDPGAYAQRLQGKTLGMLFQKSSTRTRVSFEVGMFQLGGHALFLGARDLQLGRGETIADTARVLSRYVDGIMARVFAHQDILDLARYGTVPVINGLDDEVHPCQALCDYFTIREHKGDLAGRKIAYIGDGNNMAHSLIAGAVKVGMHIAVASPTGYEPSPQVLDAVADDAARRGVRVEVTNDPTTAVQGADVVYTDVWASMGQEAEREKRLRDFAGFQVNMDLFARAKEDAIFMHCLPAHRGEEVTDEVCDHERSVIFDQAENRLHTQKAIMLLLMGE